MPGEFDELRRTKSDPHRGAILWYYNVTAIFGNDGYTSLPDDDEPAKAASRRSQEEVHCVRRKFTELEIDELGFGTEHLSLAIQNGDLFKEGRDQRLIQCRSTTAATLRPCDD